MLATNPSSFDFRLTLKSQLEDLASVWPWVEALAHRYTISAESLFAIQLCLEEALSNIVRHGYSGQANQPITVEFTLEKAWCACPAPQPLISCLFAPLALSLRL